ncbi:hypothetical protein [Algivirga pacifica]|uniref:Uncharacterized protein n=1 Tax=Algivirga pacifica TaxID=1162670 RepID=A0ABP9DP37_9BACT
MEKGKAGAWIKGYVEALYSSSSVSSKQIEILIKKLEELKLQLENEEDKDDDLPF